MTKTHESNNERSLSPETTLCCCHPLLLPAREIRVEEVTSEIKTVLFPLPSSEGQILKGESLGITSSSTLTTFTYQLTKPIF